jgi:hypothetical protein
MRFEIIMNMPVRGNDSQRREPDQATNPAPVQPPALIHRIIVDYPAGSLVDFLNETIEDDFIIVEEFYPGKFSKEYESHGLVALNRRHIGKIKQWERK